jgi:hypothetical protein
MQDRTDAYTRVINTMLFGAPPAKEVGASEAWDYVVLKAGDKEYDGWYYRHGEGVRVLKTRVRITRTEYEWIPDEKAIAELKGLMDEWRARGLSNFATSVEEQEGEEGEAVSVYESLGKTKTKRLSKTFPLSAVKFYKELPYDPIKGLREVVSEPRQNARITNLSSPPLTQ